MMRTEKEFLNTLSITIGVIRRQQKRGKSTDHDADLELLSTMVRHRMMEITGQAPWLDMETTKDWSDNNKWEGNYIGSICSANTEKQ